ncbi:MAG: putative Ig domain-containing protein [Magnetococcales bacterium]|nr:putative Ig domain-containing protein [Magnetococcales bacterium]
MPEFYKIILFILIVTTCSDAWSAAPRVVNAIPDQTWTGSGSKSFQMPANTFRDNDGDTLTYSARRANGSALPSWLRFIRSTRTFIGNPPTGILKIGLKVIANDGHGNTASSPFTLNLTETNDSPQVINNIRNQIWSGSGIKSFVVPADTFLDGDADTLIYTATQDDDSALPSWLTFTPRTRTFSGNPPAEAIALGLKITADDGHGGTGSHTFTLSFSGNTNDPPTLRTPIVDQTWSGSGAKSFQIPENTFSDRDGDTLAYTARLNDGSALPGWLTFDPATRSFTGNPPAGATAKSLKVFASDGNGGTISSTFTLAFRQTNDPPTVVTPIGNQTWNGSGSKNFQVPANTFTDGDGESLRYSATLADGSALPAWLSFNATTQTFSGNPPAGIAPLDLRVTASDGKGGSGIANFTLSFTATSDGPTVATPLANQTWSGSGVKSFQVPANTFADGDRDALTYTATLANGSQLPAWLIFAPGTRTFSGNPPAGASTLNLKVIANDGNGGSVSASFTLTINAPNDPPTVTTPIANQTWTGSGSRSFQVPANTFTDAEGDSLTYSAALADGSALPAWLTFAANSRTFSGNPPAGASTLNLKVTANDGNGGSVSASFMLTINIPNDPPTVTTPIANQTWTGSGSRSFQVLANTFTDAEGDSLTYSASLADGSALPAWLTFAANSRTFSGNPPAGASTLNLKVTANDGNGGSVRASFTLTINTPNDPPTVTTPIANQTWTGSGSQSFQVPANTFTDTEGDSLTYSAALVNGSALPAWLSFSASTRTFTGTPPVGTSTLQVKVTASDNHGGTAESVFNFNLINVIPNLTIDDVTVTEGNSGSTNVTFTVTLDSASSQTVSVQYNTGDGTATMGSDYLFTSGTLTFDPGETSKSVSVTVLGDLQNEGNESFYLHLHSVSGAVIARNRGMATIIDDDAGRGGVWNRAIWNTDHWG